MLAIESRQVRAVAGAAMLLLGGVVLAREPLPMRHVHGLGYSADGSTIVIPGHHGLMVYNGERWSIAPGPGHDYMGFTVTRESIFTSGHVAPGGGVGTSLGLLRSRDGGRSWTSLGFEAEAEFHAVAAGYESNALYLYNPAPNSRMPRAGLYRMMKDGLRWRGVGGQGVRGDMLKLAVHPSDEAMLAAVTRDGLFLSRNGGDDFHQIMHAVEPRSAYFPLDGDTLWYGTFDARPGLFRMAIAIGEPEEIVLPPIGRDTVAYIAQNPARRTEFAIVTFERAVFLTPDRGRSWKRIARPRGT